MSKPAEEHRPGVKRGAFPTPRADIERAERFVPAAPDTDDADEDTAPGTDDATDPSTARPDAPGRP